MLLGSFYKYEGHQGEDPHGTQIKFLIALHDNIDVEAEFKFFRNF